MDKRLTYTGTLNSEEIDHVRVYLYLAEAIAKENFLRYMCSRDNILYAKEIAAIFGWDELTDDEAAE